jgi:sulfonate transport system ATP-binding protein
VTSTIQHLRTDPVDTTVPLPAQASPQRGRAVRVAGLSKHFAGRTILDGLDLSIARGEFVCLLGHSGSGKSTLLRALAGIDVDVTGTVLVPERRTVVFQDPRLLPWRRVLPNVTIGLPNNSPTRARARAALGEVGLSEHTKKWPRTLSGGEAQRTALARALVREPELLLLDEPFGALDALTRIHMHALLRQLYQQHQPAVLLVTHDIGEAVELGERVLVLKDGAISFDSAAPDATHQSDRPAWSAAELRARLFEELGVTATATSSEPTQSNVKATS